MFTEEEIVQLKKTHPHPRLEVALHAAIFLWNELILDPKKWVTLASYVSDVQRLTKIAYSMRDEAKK
jgi:hypothetical protein